MSEDNSAYVGSTGFSHIKIVGARDHNLKGVTVSIPRGSLTVITGLSGSGKSSLAFDTIYAEGQRRYVESLSAYARQFLNMMQKPDVERIEGLSPAISIEQKTVSRNPRSTVGTVTEIYDYMRLLFARIGIAYSPATGLPITSESVASMVERLSSIKQGTRFYLLAPIVRNRKGAYENDLKSLLKQGFQRVKIDGKFYELNSVPKLNQKLKHDIDVVVDRIVINSSISRRLADSLETCLKLSDGIAIAEYYDELNSDGSNKRILFSSRLSCPSSGFCIEEIEPRLFSFNSVKGYCPSCSGIGTNNELDDTLLVENGSLSLSSGAITPWSRSSSVAPYYLQTLDSLAKHYNFSLDTAFADLPSSARKAILYGSDGKKISFSYKTKGSSKNSFRNYNVARVFEGVRGNLLRRYRETDSEMMREQIERFMSRTPCTSCGGQRLCEAALAVQIAGKNISQINNLSVRDASFWFDKILPSLSKNQKTIANSILKEITYRLRFLLDVGLGYLELSRESGSLSGGESQRIRLASQIGSGLTGVLYVLDEPSIGLHQSDNKKLIKTLFRLRDLGNTLIMVEHDEDAIRSADYIIDMGPGAGIYGGEIIASGSIADISACKSSITGDYLVARKFIPIPQKRRSARDGKYLTIIGANQNNLKNIEVSFPLSCLTVVTGVSGSGKSSLVMETLHKSLNSHLNRTSKQAKNYKEIKGMEFVDKVIVINQAPIGRTPRSNPATYIGAFGPIREWFSKLPEAKVRGYKAGRFSFNVKGGRCENCQGAGLIKIEMHFLADVYVDCDICKGKRYNKETLEILYKNKSISDILNMSVAEGLEFFKSVPAIFGKLSMMQKVGLDYIKIGQSATTLSGGEAQRIKLSKELAKRSIGQTVYILDEPTTGLHFHDVSRLIKVLNRLVDNGHSVIVIEHNLDVIKSADYLIDIGPRGGDEGGELIFAGTPDEIVSAHFLSKSLTGQFLKPILNTAPKKTA